MGPGVRWRRLGCASCSIKALRLYVEAVRNPSRPGNAGPAALSMFQYPRQGVQDMARYEVVDRNPRLTRAAAGAYSQLRQASQAGLRGTPQR